MTKRVSSRQIDRWERGGHGPTDEWDRAIFLADGGKKSYEPDPKPVAKPKKGKRK